MKQILLCVTQYTQDYDENYPLRNQGVTNKNQWPVMVQPYVKNTQIFQCPSDADTTNLDSATFHMSYLGNSIGSGSSTDTSGLFGVTKPIPVPAVAFPTTTIAITDGAFEIQNSASTPAVTTPPFYDRNSANWTKTYQSYMVTRPSAATTNSAYAAPADRHLDTVVVGFVDGHVKSMKLDSIYDSASPACLNYKTGCA